MSFASVDFLVFFLTFFGIYWWLPLRVQNYWLLGASYFFYGYITPWWAGLLAATTLVDYTCGRLLAAYPERKKLFLGVSLTSNFGVLCTMKYYNFFMDNITAAFQSLGFDISAPHWQILLPAGVSFYTFQSSAYVIDVYRGNLKARRDLLDFATYISFFPQLVAGPIERAGHLLAQVERARRFDPLAARDGLFLILWGLTKKRVIADNVSVYSDKAFSLADPSFPIVWGGVLCFCVQIYADFSAYTDIARGTSRLLGFELMKNFNHPYAATSPVDFWRRWHISLSTWFRDYVYIPLGGSRCQPWRARANLFATFLLSGLWHGASWNFILWGAWHGAWVILWHVLSPGFKSAGGGSNRLVSFSGWLLTFIVVNIGWLLFREQNVAMLGHHFSQLPWQASLDDWRMGAFFTMQAILLALPLVLHGLLEKPLLSHWPDFSDKWLAVSLQSAVGILLFCLLLLLSSRVAGDFIYFKF